MLTRRGLFQMLIAAPIIVAIRSAPKIDRFADLQYQWAIAAAELRGIIARVYNVPKRYLVSWNAIPSAKNYKLYREP